MMRSGERSPEGAIVRPSINQSLEVEEESKRSRLRPTLGPWISSSSNIFQRWAPAQVNGH
jgi:hypothetical protein